MNIFFKWKENVQSVREKYPKIEVILKKQEEDQYFVNIIRRADIQKMKTPQQIRNEVEKEIEDYKIAEEELKKINHALYLLENGKRHKNKIL